MMGDAQHHRLYANREPQAAPQAWYNPIPSQGHVLQDGRQAGWVQNINPPLYTPLHTHVTCTRKEDVRYDPVSNALTVVLQGEATVVPFDKWGKRRKRLITACVAVRIVAAHGVAPACACLCTKAPVHSSPVGMCKLAHSSTFRAKQQTSIEDSNSGKLCIILYIIYTETQNHRGQSFSVGAQQLKSNQGIYGLKWAYKGDKNKVVLLRVPS
eukprot:1160988-Pelagomonas_calceolata.AAC.1